MGGKEKFTVSMACYQKSRGLDVAVAYFKPENEFADLLKEGGVPFRFLEGGGFYGIRTMGAVRRMVSEGGWDILHCHNETSMVYGAGACLALPKVRMVATIHNGARDGYSLKQKIENRLAFARARSIVCVAAPIAKSLKEREFAPMGKVSVIDNGVPEPKRPSPEALAALREQLGLGAGPTAVFVGRMDPVKNIPGFLEAFALALKEHPEATLLVAGDGPLRGEVAAKAAALGLGPRARLLGTRKDIPALLAVSDVFVLPSFHEGHSISLLEACSMEKAILASRRGGNPDIVTDGESGLLADPEDRAGMAASLCSLFRDADLRARLGKGAVSRYRADFGMERCHASYMEAYGAPVTR